MTAPRTPADYMQKIETELKKAIPLMSKIKYVDIKELISLIRETELNKVPLNLAKRDGRFSILSIAAAANEAEFLESLLARPEFHLSRFKFEFEDFSTATGYDVVEVFSKHLGSETLSKISLSCYLSIHNDYWHFEKIYKQGKSAEQECKALKTYEESKIIELLKKATYDDYDIYNILHFRGVTEINKNKKLLQNYNKVLQTYACGNGNNPSKGHLKALYIMRVALDSMSGDEVWKLYQRYAFVAFGINVTAFPDGNMLYNCAAKSVLALYIINNPDKFSFVKREDLNNLLMKTNSGQSYLNFTGHIPQFGFISKKNWSDVVNSVMANNPRKDIFNFANDSVNEAKSTEVAVAVKDTERKELSSPAVIRNVFDRIPAAPAATPVPAIRPVVPAAEKKLTPEEAFLSKCSPYTKAYIESFKDKKSHSDIIKEMNLTKEELDTLADCHDQLISMDIMNKPLMLNECVYDFNTIINFNGLDPQRIPFEPRDVQPYRKAVTDFENGVKRIVEARKAKAEANKSAQPEIEAAGGAPGGPSFERPAGAPGGLRF